MSLVYINRLHMYKLYKKKKKKKKLFSQMVHKIFNIQCLV